MANAVILWTCVAVFVATAAITLLGITNRIAIDKTYLNALFAALILETVAIGMAGFRGQTISPFVRITSPTADLTLRTGHTLFVAGVGVVGPGQQLKCSVSAGGRTTRHEAVQLGAKGFFTLPHEVESVQAEKTTAECRITDGTRVLAADTSTVMVGRAE